MRSVFVLYLLLAMVFHADSQQDRIDPEEIIAPKADTIEHVFNVCGSDAVIPADWKTYLETNLQPDSLLLDTVPAGRYTINASFVIDINGRVTDVVIKNDPGHGLGNFVKKVIEAYKGKWRPAELHGRAIKSYRMQPVTIIIEEEEECTDPLPQKFIL